MNKMTPVSLSIVFGPNIFHCGDGIQGLQLQGFSNSTVCRMVLYHAVLFGGVEEIKIHKRSSPIRPRPYSEHVADKKTRPVSHVSHPHQNFDLSMSCDRACLELQNASLS